MQTNCTSELWPIKQDLPHIYLPVHSLRKATKNKASKKVSVIAQSLNNFGLLQLNFTLYQSTTISPQKYNYCLRKLHLRTHISIEWAGKLTFTTVRVSRMLGWISQLWFFDSWIFVKNSSLSLFSNCFHISLVTPTYLASIKI